MNRRPGAGMSRVIGSAHSAGATNDRNARGCAGAEKSKGKIRFQRKQRLHNSQLRAKDKELHVDKRTRKLDIVFLAVPLTLWSLLEASSFSA